MPELADIDRRTIANLSNPRSVAELAHVLRVDPYTETRSEHDVGGHLDVLRRNHLAVNLGEPKNFAKLISRLPSDALPVHDDTARKWVGIMQHPLHEWRTHGDQWLLTQAGFDALHDQSDAPPPLTPTEVQQVVNSEFKRTITDVSSEDIKPDDSVSITGVLLWDEFNRWFTLVADECERIWNVRPQIPMAGGAGWSELYARLIVDHENQKTALPALVTPWYMALFTTNPTDATAYSALVEATYTGYARKSVAAADMAAASGTGSAANVNAIQFAACTALTSTVISFGNVADASGSTTTAGFRKWGTCASTVISTTQTPAQFAIGAYTTTAD